MASADLSRINTNIAALNALNALNKVNSEMSMHQLRLATGKKINSASDDAAGFTIASKLKVKSEGLGTALDNIGSAKNLMTVAEGHLTNIQEILAKMKSKAEQAASDTLGTSERTAIFNEIKEYNNQIDSEVAQAKWAGVDILSTSKSFQIGVGTSSSDALSFNVAGGVSGFTGTTFDASGLSVNATSTNTEVIANVQHDAVAATVAAGTTVLNGIGTTSLAISSSLGTAVADLASGNYNLVISSAVAGGTTTFSLQLKTAGGTAVSIEADGNVTTSAASTTLTFAVAGTTSIDPGVINLGNGLTVDLGAIGTASLGAAGTIALTFSAYTATVAAGANTAAVARSNDVTDQAGAQAFMGKIDTAIDNVSAALSYVGTQYNRLTFQEQSMTVAKVNTESAYSQIVNADMAWEQLQSTKLQILQQTATAMLAQANVAPQSILSLFK